MSILGNVFGAVKKGVTDVGHAVGSVASNPIAKTLAALALTATGAGAPAGAMLMGGMGAAGGALKPGGGLKQAVGGGITGAASGALAGKLGQLARGVVGAAGSVAGHGGVADASTPGDGSVGLVDRLKNAAGSVGSSLLGGGGGGGTDGGTSLLDKLLMGGTVAAGAYDQAQKQGMQNRAADYATAPYDAKAPIRAKALAQLAAPQTVDPRIAAFSADPGNVYDRARRARSLAAAATTPAPMVS